MADPAPVEDEDTRQAFVARFGADPDLTANCPGGMRSGKIPSDVKTGSVVATISPYATVDCEQGPRANEYMAPLGRANQGYHDYRKVTIEVYGIRASVLLVMGHLRRVFEWQPKGDKAMTIPNASLKRVMPLPGSGRMEEQAERVQGNPVWKGTINYEVWTVRTIP